MKNVDLLTKSVPNMEKLILAECWQLTDFSVCSIGSNGCGKLTYLDMGHCSKIVGMVPMKKGTKSPAGHMSVVSLKVLGLGCPMLEFVCFSHCRSITPDRLETLFGHCMDLKELRLNRVSNIQDATVFSMVRFCSALRKLNLNDCELVTDKALQYLSSGCPRLVHLSLSFCKSITDTGIFHLATSQGIDATSAPTPKQSYSGSRPGVAPVRCFEYFDFTGCILLSDLAVTKFVPASLRNLKYISFRFCKNISDATSKYLGNNASALEVADFTRCPNIIPENTMRYLPKCKSVITDGPKVDKYAKHIRRPVEVRREPLYSVPKPTVPNNTAFKKKRAMSTGLIGPRHQHFFLTALHNRAPLSGFDLRHPLYDTQPDQGLFEW